MGLVLVIVLKNTSIRITLMISGNLTVKKMISILIDFDEDFCFIYDIYEAKASIAIKLIFFIDSLLMIEQFFKKYLQTNILKICFLLNLWTVNFSKHVIKMLRYQLIYINFSRVFSDKKILRLAQN
jgi:hypothetical protein